MVATGRNGNEGPIDGAASFAAVLGGSYNPGRWRQIAGGGESRLAASSLRGASKKTRCGSTRDGFALPDSMTEIGVNSHVDSQMGA